MFIKLGIIAGAVILGGMIFSTEIDRFFPTTSATLVDSIKDDVTNLSSEATSSVEKRIDESINTIVDKTSSTLNNEITDAGEKITIEISEAKESSQKTINEKVSNFDPVEYIKNIFS